ncbi:MAG: HAMP domain-containing protein [Rhizobiales bacterium]|nr:HAMP domain-containing protein [Hyphomicrobiales bacterium]MBI3674588.1 HAMP domain-containing protein [Hyphomicrobiales bacterium]
MTRLWPRSLPSFILVIVVLALGAAQVVTLLTVSREVARTNRVEDLFRLGERTLAIARGIADTPKEVRAKFLANIKSADLTARIDAEPAVGVIASNDEMAEIEDLLMSQFSDEGILDIRIDEVGPGAATAAAGKAVQPGGANTIERELSRVTSQFATTNRHIVSMQLADGAWLNFSLATTPAPTIVGSRTLPLLLGLLAAIVALCLWAVIQLTQPYRRLERAAAKIGADLNTVPIPETGSSEVRAAIRAINAMQVKLRDYVADREHLAAALAHDLRTPLTRLKLRCELMKEGRQKHELQADVQDLQNLVASVIDFASMTKRQEEKTKVDIVSLLQTVCADYRKAKVAPDTAALNRVVVAAQPVALGRCLGNLVGNAIRYGGSATVSVRLDGANLEILVDDEGPGIPGDELAKVLKPFYRLEGSRNQAFGGTGLGLAIADTIARAHGGTLRLENRPEGGTRAILSLPRGREFEPAAAPDIVSPSAARDAPP